MKSEPIGNTPKSSIKKKCHESDNKIMLINFNAFLKTDIDMDIMNDQNKF
jgi:hypothetical protein